MTQPPLRPMLAVLVSALAGACFSDLGSDSTTTAAATTGTTTTGTTSEPTSSSTSTTSTSTRTTTGEPDTTTGIVSTSTSSSTSTGSSSTGVECIDLNEPNETAAEAIDLGMQTCDTPPAKLMGTLDGAADVDHFKFLGAFTGTGCALNDPDPIVDVTLTSFDTLRLCVHVECIDPDGEGLFTCPPGTTQDMSPEGRRGCCGAQTVNFQLNCNPSTEESATIYVRVDQASVDACAAYAVDYSYHPMK